MTTLLAVEAPQSDQLCDVSSELKTSSSWGDTIRPPAVAPLGGLYEIRAALADGWAWLTVGVGVGVESIAVGSDVTSGQRSFLEQCVGISHVVILFKLHERVGEILHLSLDGGRSFTGNGLKRLCQWLGRSRRAPRRGSGPRQEFRLGTRHVIAERST